MSENSKTRECAGMSRAPQRIQRKRSKGWRMPEGSVYVGRPTCFGNPFSVADYDTQQNCVDAYRTWIEPQPTFHGRIIRELRGKDLACWCPLDQPCHADVLLEIANAEEKIS